MRHRRRRTSREQPAALVLWLGLLAALILEPVGSFPEERVVFCAEYLMLVKCLLAYS